MAIVGAGPSGLAALRALDGGGLRRHRLRARRAHRRRLDAGGPADRGLPLAAPDHEPRAHGVRRAPDAARARPTTRAATRRPLPRGLRRALRPARAHPAGRRGRARRAAAGGGWELELADGERASADVLVVANGHNDVPKWPDPPYPGEFDGEQLHALDYDDSAGFAGKRVLVVGMGNSAMDIATDLSHVAERTLLSVRHGSWVIPKRLLGRPADQVVSRGWRSTCPGGSASRCPSSCCGWWSGAPERYGLPAPAARPVPGPPDDLRHDPQPHQPRPRSRPSRRSRS